MVGLTDHNIRVNARIRVGQDFGCIKYIGTVSHQNFLFLKKYEKIYRLDIINRLMDMMVSGLVLNGMIHREEDTTELSMAIIILKLSKLMNICYLLLVSSCIEQ